ncbi:MAG: M23 family metallopeptidase [Hyphococcus sp.]
MRVLATIGFGVLAAASAASAQAVPQSAADENVASETAPDAAMLARKADYAEAMRNVTERQKVFDDEPARYSLEGTFSQGGLVFGQTEPGAKVRLDGDDVMVGSDGRFVMGFGRDSAASALLVVELPDGAVERRALEIADREFPVQRIDGLDQSKVSGFTEEQLAKIAIDREKKKAARQKTQGVADWAAGFDWPVTGPISGVFGSQRILNGEPKRPHSGVDVAAPTGAPIRAPAPGIVTLAETGMYFEGGLVLIDHGHWLESAFLHMSRIDVEPGQRVEKGDVIGAVGATGRVTGPHLHWSIKWAGRLVDPQLTAGPMPETTPAAGD